NFNPTVPTNVMVQTAAHPACDGLWIANTIPWGTAGIDWTGLFGSHQSPLAKYGFGNGGLSGPACLAFTINRVVSARDAGIAKPIVAGNGIQSADDVRRVRQAGADAVALGVIGIVRPWRMRSTIQAGNQYQVAA
ncbi:MAG TPA: hypothetical protein VK963_00020, partial [Candidatus Saccharimonadales bacterium]|nr:hypothetical protein [Candidatus Saccharimonadales bacterium]